MINFLKLYQKFDDIISYVFSNTVNEKKFLKSYFKNKKIIVIDIGSNYGNFIDIDSSIFLNSWNKMPLIW